MAENGNSNINKKINNLNKKITQLLTLLKKNKGNTESVTKLNSNLCSFSPQSLDKNLMSSNNKKRENLHRIAENYQINFSENEINKILANSKEMNSNEYNNYFLKIIRDKPVKNYENTILIESNNLSSSNLPSSNTSSNQKNTSPTKKLIKEIREEKNGLKKNFNYSSW